MVDIYSGLDTGFLYPASLGPRLDGPDSPLKALSAQYFLFTKTNKQTKSVHLSAEKKPSPPDPG